MKKTSYDLGDLGFTAQELEELRNTDQEETASGVPNCAQQQIVRVRRVVCTTHGKEKKGKISMQTQPQIHEDRPMMIREIPALGRAGNMLPRRKAQTAIVVLVFAFAILAFAAPKASAQSVATKTCPPLSQGFWKNHASAWKVTSLTLGTRNYTQAQLLAILETPPRGDASLILAHQLIAAKLNTAVIGTDPSKVAATIKDADTLLGVGPIPEGVRASSTIGQ